MFFLFAALGQQALCRLYFTVSIISDELVEGSGCSYCWFFLVVPRWWRTSRSLEERLDDVSFHVFLDRNGVCSASRTVCNGIVPLTSCWRSGYIGFNVTGSEMNERREISRILGDFENSGRFCRKKFKATEKIIFVNFYWSYCLY